MNIRTNQAQDVTDPPKPFSAFVDAGLLWLINSSVFHPRGYAVAFARNDSGEVIGWTLLGDGTEPWAFAGDDLDDQRFRAASELLGGIGQ